MSSPSILDGVGSVLSSVNVVLIFWGRSWQRADVQPPVPSVVDAIQSMASGPYLSALAQYRGITNGRLHTTTMAPSDPKQVFSGADLEKLVRSCVEARA
jgi:hypothetical protein